MCRTLNSIEVWCSVLEQQARAPVSAHHKRIWSEWRHCLCWCQGLKSEAGRVAKMSGGGGAGFKGEGGWTWGVARSVSVRDVPRWSCGFAWSGKERGCVSMRRWKWRESEGGRWVSVSAVERGLLCIEKEGIKWQLKWGLIISGLDSWKCGDVCWICSGL